MTTYLELNKNLTDQEQSIKKEVHRFAEEGKPAALHIKKSRVAAGNHQADRAGGPPVPDEIGREVGIQVIDAHERDSELVAQRLCKNHAHEE